jgi:hypothetical protein
MITTYAFLSGFIMAMCLMVSAFFFRFWRKTSDRFFIYFSISFAMIGLERLTQLFVYSDDLRLPYTYLIRLVAFMVIIGAIIDKNYTSK